MVSADTQPRRGHLPGPAAPRGDVEVNQLVLKGFLRRLDCVVDVRENGAEACPPSTAGLRPGTIGTGGRGLALVEQQQLSPSEETNEASVEWHLTGHSCPPPPRTDSTRQKAKPYMRVLGPAR